MFNDAVCHRSRSLEKRGPKTDVNFFTFGSLLMDNASAMKMCDKTTGFLHISHRRTTPTRHLNRRTTAP